MRMDAEFTFSRAGRADERDLRRLVASTPMPGPIVVRFEREPDYFHGCSVMGDVCDVLIARHRPDGDLAGVLCRTERRAFVEGTEVVVGGVGQVRVARRYRGRGLLRRGWPVFADRGLLYSGVIARGNANAVHALVNRAPHAPRLVRVDGVTTVGLAVGRRRQRPRSRGLEVRSASRSELAAILAFLREQGPRRNLFPAYTVDDFTRTDRLRDLEMGDIAVAWRGSRIVGTLACWDQRGFKQDVVNGYLGMLGRIRPVLDLAGRALGIARIPAPGTAIAAGFAAAVCIHDDDRMVFDRLLDASLARARSRGLDWLMLGFADRDPLLAIARSRLHVPYRADLYAASWGSVDPAVLGRRPCYVDVGTL